MKYNTLRAFEKHLEAATPDHFSSVYVILSKDGFERRQAVEKLLQFLRKGLKLSSFCEKSLDGENLDPLTLKQELGSFSLFSNRQILLIQQADKLNSSCKEILQGFFTQPNRSLFLILSAAALAPSTRFYQQAEKAGVILELPFTEKAWEKEKLMVEWLLTQAQNAGKGIDHATCQLLLKKLGTDPAFLFQEWEKLICYVGDRSHINKQDVEAICGSIPLETIWQLGEALFQRDVASALRISKGLISEGVAFFSLIRQVRSQFQTEYQVCSLLVNGGGPNEITAAFPYMKGAILERHMQMARKYGIEAFKQALIEIDHTEVDAKNSSVSPEILLDRLIIKLTDNSRIHEKARTSYST